MSELTHLVKEGSNHPESLTKVFTGAEAIETSVLFSKKKILKLDK